MGRAAHRGRRVGLAVGSVIGVDEGPFHLDEADQVAALIHDRDAHGHLDLSRLGDGGGEDFLDCLGGELRRFGAGAQRETLAERGNQENRPDP